jgi:hypothetical protein
MFSNEQGVRANAKKRSGLDRMHQMQAEEIEARNGLS